MRMPRTACANSAGSAASPTRPRNVRFGSAFDSTVALSISVPSSSTTPRVRPPRTSTRATGAFVADLGAEAAGRRRHGLGDRAHAADHVPVEALLLVLAPREQVEQQAQRRARLVGPAVLAVDVVGQEQRLDLVRLVVAVEELAEAAGQERRPSPRSRRREMPRNAPPHAQRPRGGRRARWRARPAAAPGRRAAGSARASSSGRPRARTCPRPPGRGAAISSVVRSRSGHQASVVRSGKGTSRAGEQGTMRSPWARRRRSRITSGRSMLAM